MILIGQFEDSQIERKLIKEGAKLHSPHSDHINWTKIRFVIVGNLSKNQPKPNLVIQAEKIKTVHIVTENWAKQCIINSKQLGSTSDHRFQCSKDFWNQNKQQTPVIKKEIKREIKMEKNRKRRQCDYDYDMEPTLKKRKLEQSSKFFFSFIFCFFGKQFEKFLKMFVYILEIITFGQDHIHKTKKQISEFNESFMTEPDDEQDYAGFDVTTESDSYSYNINGTKLLFKESTGIKYMLRMIEKCDSSFEFDQILRRHNEYHNHNINHNNITPCLLMSLLVENYCVYCGQLGVDTACRSCLYRFHAECIKKNFKTNIKRGSSQMYHVDLCELCKHEVH